VKSATRDPRFPPLTQPELDDLHIEISVLSAFQRVTDLDQIEIGNHGLVIESRRGRGLLLPVVPVSRGWDKTQFLEHLCRKAGLPVDAWKEGTELYAFTAEEFGEATDRELPSSGSPH
jgi:AmmeMemoRadiSam system protein A